MVLFYTCSYYGKQKYQKWYDLVRKTIKEFPIELLSPEEGNYQSVLNEETKKHITDPKVLHYEAIRQGIHQAEVMIVEVSHEDIQLGHEITLALSEKKPVLCLSIHEDYSKKIHHDYFVGAKYNEHNIKSIIQNFLARARELTLSKRFNMFLYPSQIEYVEKIGKQTGMNMSEYIRHLINLDKRNTRLGETSQSS
ncbi:MAG: hypothetical protein ABID64_01655 [Nitrospirota bacterium]